MKRIIPKARRVNKTTGRGETPAKMYAVGNPQRGGRTVCRPFLHSKRSPFGSSDYGANVTAFLAGVLPLPVICGLF